MVKRLISGIAIISAFSCSTISAAGWNYVNKTDDFNDEQVMYTDYLDQDHRIQIKYSDYNDVWMFITRNKDGHFSPNGLIELRVDKNETKKINPIDSRQLEKIVGLASFRWEPKTVGFLIWHGDESEGCGFIKEIMTGGELKIRYQMDSLIRDSFSVNLYGAKNSLISGLNLSICGK